MSDKTQQYGCPIQGCDYSAESPGSVKAHISRTTTVESHEGESGPDYDGDITPVSLEDGGESAGSDPEPETPTEPAETSTATDGGAGVVPEDQSWSQSNQSQNQDQNQTEPPTCPGCGSTEYMNAGVALENNRGQLSREHIALLESSEYVCTECGGVFDAE